MISGAYGVILTLLCWSADCIMTICPESLALHDESLRLPNQDLGLTRVPSLEWVQRNIWVLVRAEDASSVPNLHCVVSICKLLR